ncbi:hypothetical protein [Caudoviricetes sp.]|nr:hypothetical protein [Caudoviricetes sp.]
MCDVNCKIRKSTYTTWLTPRWSRIPHFPLTRRTYCQVIGVTLRLGLVTQLSPAKAGLSYP